jgi:hypothetical protein
VGTTGAYASAFALAAAINLLGALTWLAFATGERILVAEVMPADTEAAQIASLRWV